MMEINLMTAANKIAVNTTDRIVKLSGAAKLPTGRIGSVGLGCSKARPASSRGGAKVNNSATVADSIIVDNTINAIAFKENNHSEKIYGEFSTENGCIPFICDGKNITYQSGNKIEGPLEIMPIMIWALRNNSEFVEFKEVFRTVTSAYLDTGVVEVSNLFLLSDAFYFEVCKNLKTINVEENLDIDAVKDVISKSIITKLALLKDIDAPSFSKVNINSRRKASSKKLDIIKAIKEGQFLLNYNWSDEERAKIPSLSLLDDFIPNETFYSLVYKLHSHLEKVIMRLDGGSSGIDAIQKDYINSMLIGKPGTGKTKTLFAVAAALGMPIYSVPLTKNTEEDTFQGMNKVINGQISFVETDTLKAVQHGGIVIFEEINLADPAVTMGSLGQLLEYPFILEKDGYEQVTRHPLFVAFGTMNIGTWGSKGINQALSSRFKQSYILNEIDENDFINILKKQVSMNDDISIEDTSFKMQPYEEVELNNTIIKWVYNAYDAIISYLNDNNAEDLALNVTTRGCIGALENISDGEEPKRAIINTLVGKIAESDLELAEKIKTDLVLNLPDLLW